MKFNCAYDELVDLEKIVPNPENNNHHPQKQIERLAKIIDWQGQRSPIVISTRSGFIVKGHGRFEAIKSLGWEKAAVDYQDYESEAQEYADMTADNQIATWAEFDEGAVLSKLPDLNIDYEMLGMVEIPTLDDCETDMPDLASGDKEPFQQMTFTLADGQAETIKEAISKAKGDSNFEYVDKMGNENSNGNALFFVVQEWLNGKC